MSVQTMSGEPIPGKFGALAVILPGPIIRIITLRDPWIQHPRYVQSVLPPAARRLPAILLLQPPSRRDSRTPFAHCLSYTLVMVCGWSVRQQRRQTQDPNHQETLDPDIA
jgi:hypothetical protein